jgi:hypothetical protein
MSNPVSVRKVLLAGVGLATICLLAAGCGSEGVPLNTVSGEVTKDGQPVANAMLMFMPQEKGAASAGQTDASGRFELKFSDGRPGALPGKHRVVITLAGPEAAPPTGGQQPPLPVADGPTEFVREAEVKADGPTQLSFDLSE